MFIKKLKNLQNRNPQLNIPLGGILFDFYILKNYSVVFQFANLKSYTLGAIHKLLHTLGGQGVDEV